MAAGRVDIETQLRTEKPPPELRVGFLNVQTLEGNLSSEVHLETLHHYK